MDYETISYIKQALSLQELMEHKEYKLLKDRERFFWWNVGRRRILREALMRHLDTHVVKKRKVLDVGCGTGGNILFLNEFGNVVGLDSSEEALQYARLEGYHDVVLSSAYNIPFPENFFDTVAALDVIEHIEDDLRVLKEIQRVLKPGGILLLTVPVYPWMWSEHDLALHHKRRYRRTELLFKIADAGFHVKESSYFVIPSIPFRALKIFFQKINIIFHTPHSRILKTDDVILPPFLNTLFIMWLAVERHIIKIFPLPFGSSLLVVAKKPL